MSLRFDPFRESFREMDRLAHQLRSGTAMPAPMPMDVWRSGDAYLVALDLPGIDASTLDITLERGSLSIRAERRRAFGEGETVLVAERPQGTFTRQLMLGDEVDQDAVEADFRDGVLMLRIPVAQAAQPRRIEVRRPASDRGQAGDGRRIEGTAPGSGEARAGQEAPALGVRIANSPANGREKVDA